jgi:hypothetical protein
VRGGIYTTVVVEQRQPGWQPPAEGRLPGDPKPAFSCRNPRENARCTAHAGP